MPVTMSSAWQRPLLLWAETVISRVWQPDVHCIRTRWNSEPGEVLWIACVHTCVCRYGCTAASACHETCVLRMTRSGTLPFLVRVLKCVQRVIVWCVVITIGKVRTSRTSNQLLNQPLNPAVNSHTHYITCRVHYATHRRYVMEIHPINI